MFADLLYSDCLMLHPLMRFYCRYKYGALGFVYMLHRVCQLDKNGILYNENMKVSPQFLENLILSYRKQGFEFLSVDDLYELMRGNRKQRKPFVIFTLDDGYVDNYTIAYPIFKKYKVPFCIYVATDFPDNKAFLWWYAIEEYLSGDADKNEKFVEMRQKVLAFPREHFINDCRTLLSDFDLNPLKYVQTEALTWSQIVEMSNDPLCTIGGHSVSHPAFSSLKENEIRLEIEEGVKILQNHIKKPITHFAYPYGSLNEVNEREYNITEDYGFKTIMTTIQGFITKKSNVGRLPRYMLFDKNYLK